jgi:hypothetical protein
MRSNNKLILSILVLILAGAGIYFAIRHKGSKGENAGPALYNIYSSPEGIQFAYPKTWGEVTAKEGNTVCPEEDTYRTGDTLSIFDKEYGWSSIKLAGSESFMETGVRTYLLDPKDPNKCGDDFFLMIARGKVKPETISSYRLNSIVNQSGLTGTYNAEASRLNTESRTQYTYFVLQGDKILVIQPYMSFIPFFDSPEEKELKGNYGGDMAKYLEEGETAAPIRAYMDEFRKLAFNMKFGTI